MARQPLWLASAIPLLAATPPVAHAGPDGGDEFVGPFPSWRDARRDYGARGDGNSTTKGVTKNGFEALPDVPATGVDDDTLLRHLAPLRAVRVWTLGPSPPSVTDVRIHRVLVNAAGVRFAGGSRRLP